MILSEIIEEIRRQPKLILADDYEISVSDFVSEKNSFRDGLATEVAQSRQTMLRLRLLHRRQPGRASVEFNGKGSLTELVDSALECANGSSPDPWFKFPYWKRQLESSIQYGDSNFDVQSQYTMLPEAPVLFDEEYLKESHRLQIFQKNERNSLFREGQRIVARYSLLNRSKAGFYWTKESRARRLGTENCGAWVQSLAAQSQSLKEAAEWDGEATNFYLFSPSVMAQLLKSLSNSLRADWAHAGRSRSLEWLGTQVFSPVLSISDEADLEGAAYCSPFDGEGVAIQRNDLVRDGVLQSLLFDTYWGAHHNRASTGSCLDRGHGPWPQIEARCFTVEPSSYRLDDLLGTMGEGLYWTQASHFQVSDLSTGTFTLSGSGWRVVNGKPDHPVHGLYLTGSLYDLFKSVIAVGDDLDLFGRFASPSMLVEFSG